MSEAETGVLYNLLFGSPLVQRVATEGGDTAVAGLNPVLRGIIPVLERSLGQPGGDPLEQATLEWKRVIGLKSDYAGVAAKRAVLLFALWREREVREHFRKSDPTLVKELEARVLPLVMPLFVRELAQTPDALVVLVYLILSMWDAEDLGAAAHDKSPTRLEDDGAD